MNNLKIVAEAFWSLFSILELFFKLLRKILEFSFFLKNHFLTFVKKTGFHQPLAFFEEIWQNGGYSQSFKKHATRKFFLICFLTFSEFWRKLLDFFVFWILFNQFLNMFNHFLSIGNHFRCGIIQIQDFLQKLFLFFHFQSFVINILHMFMKKHYQNHLLWMKSYFLDTKSLFFIKSSHI